MIRRLLCVVVLFVLALPVSGETIVPKPDVLENIIYRSGDAFLKKSTFSVWEGELFLVHDRQNRYPEIGDFPEIVGEEGEWTMVAGGGPHGEVELMEWDAEDDVVMPNRTVRNGVTYRQQILFPVTEWMIKDAAKIGNELRDGPNGTYEYCWIVETKKVKCYIPYDRVVEGVGTLIDTESVVISKHVDTPSYYHLVVGIWIPDEDPPDPPGPPGP
jgi:hypothetical protein